MDPNSKIPRNDFPWKRCATARLCMELLLNEEVNYVVMFDKQAQYLVNQFGTFSELTRFETFPTLFTFDGGWIYNKNVPLRERHEFNKELLRLREQGRIRQIVDEMAGTRLPTIKTDDDIGPGIVGIPIALLVGIPLTILCVLLFARRQRKTCRA